MICTLRLGLQRWVVVDISGRCGITGNLIPKLIFSINRDFVGA
jgi:hypothetical protein